MLLVDFGHCVHVLLPREVEATQIRFEFDLEVFAIVEPGATEDGDGGKVEPQSDLQAAPAVLELVVLVKKQRLEKAVPLDAVFEPLEVLDHEWIGVLRMQPAQALRHVD